MQLSDTQEKAYKQLMSFISQSTNKRFILSGYAGTGKTTLIAKMINENPSYTFICCAPTGKAASVLQNKIGQPVTTIHKLIYNPSEKQVDYSLLYKLEQDIADDPNNLKLQKRFETEQKRVNSDSVEFFKKEMEEDLEHCIIVADESSMIPEKMADDLLATGAKIIFCGDEGQLPPIKGDSVIHQNNPDARLMEVHRQALDNPIIRMSMQVRQDGYIAKNDYGDLIRFCQRGELTLPEYLDADQIICGTNKVRHQSNRAIRKYLGHTSFYPAMGEKLISIRNTNFTDNRINVINGVQAIVEEEAIINSIGQHVMSVAYEGEYLPNVQFSSYPFDATYSQSFLKEKGRMPFDLDWKMKLDLYEFDYSYAITCHKSQGSEWDHVVIADDQFQINNKGIRRKWLYTAITRAKEKLTIVQ